MGKSAVDSAPSGKPSTVGKGRSTKEGEDHKLAVMKAPLRRNSSNSLKYLFWSSIFPKICLISRDLARSGSPSSSTITRRIDSATESQVNDPFISSRGISKPIPLLCSNLPIKPISAIPPGNKINATPNPSPSITELQPQ
ncbi:hypothetical protein G4B88_007483 [Cannabis sativa]|uniref:Uncharacterized protein n=1 Tax=Cannabis sativa TaxID=3483 RepID=A0A7J6HBB7_CANSA|nr:hypothetical protein G4B88_007483 [Cannabis sativa]